jgi:hypothetical protein
MVLDSFCLRHGKRQTAFTQNKENSSQKTGEMKSNRTKRLLKPNNSDLKRIPLWKERCISKSPFHFQNYPIQPKKIPFELGNTYLGHH